MFEELIVNINWLAVCVGAIVAYGLGWLWFSPKMFGNKWMVGVGLTSESKTSMTHAMITQAVGTFLLAWVLGVTETTDSLAFAILVSLTTATLVKANGFFCGKSKCAIGVEAGYIVAMVIVMISAHIIF